MTSSKPDYDLNPLEDLPPPSYAQATANASQPDLLDIHRSARKSENNPRSNGIVPNLAVAGARASHAAARNASTSTGQLVNPGNRQFGTRLHPNSESRIPIMNSTPERGRIGGTRLTHGPGERIIGHLGEKFGVTQGSPQQATGSNHGMYDRKHIGASMDGGFIRGGLGGLLGRSGGGGGCSLLGDLRNPRGRRKERRSSRVAL